MNNELIELYIKEGRKYDSVKIKHVYNEPNNALMVIYDYEKKNTGGRMQKQKVFIYSLMEFMYSKLKPAN